MRRAYPKHVTHRYLVRPPSLSIVSILAVLLPSGLLLRYPSCLDIRYPNVKFGSVKTITLESRGETFKRDGGENKIAVRGFFFIFGAAEKRLKRQQCKLNCAACKMGGLVFILGWYSLF